MKKTKLLSFVLAAAMLAIPLAGCSQDEGADGGKETIKIGGLAPLSGDVSQYGVAVNNAVKMAVEDINAKGGILGGRKIEYIVTDEKGDSTEAVNAYNALMDQEIVALIGDVTSKPCKAVAAKAAADNMPMLTPSGTDADITKAGKNVFRACFIDPYQGAAAATYAYKNLGYKKAAVLTDVANDYAVGLSNFFKKTFKKIGGELVADMKYSSGDQDFTAQLTELISKKPDIVFMPAYFAEGAIIMKQARELGATFVLMGADAMDNPDTLKIGGKAVEGFLHTTFPYDVNMENMSAEAKTFTDAWKKNFPNKDPNVNSALGYNCYNIILDALTRAGKADTEALTAALAATKNLPTALGVLSINETHDAEMPVGIIKYMDGKRKYIGEAIAE